MLNKYAALKGRMPLYKWFGNQILTLFQNFIVGTNLSEYHSGYRVYSTFSLRRIPFELNSNDFHFDTDIIIQAHFANLRIVEIPIPTYYGNEKCHVNGLKYALNICISSIRSRFHLMNLCYEKKFDVGQKEFLYDLKLEFPSSHSLVLESIQPDSTVLDIGCGQGLFSQQLLKKNCKVTALR
jgi:hypothetical protein